MNSCFTNRTIFRAVLAVIFMFFLALSTGALETSFQRQGVAEDLIFQQIANRRVIDLATNSIVEANRSVRGEFLEWLLTKGQKEIHHSGLRLRNAIVTNWLDLRNLEVDVEVRFESCHFMTNVNLSGAHFLHDLSFEGSKLDGKLMGTSLKVGGSLMLGSCVLLLPRQP